MPENLVSRDGFDSPVPRQPAHLHTQAESGAYLRDSSRVPRRRPCIYLNHFTPSGQSQVYRVAQLRTDAVHCREFAGTWAINLKVFPNECCLSRSPRTTFGTILLVTFLFSLFYLPETLGRSVAEVEHAANEPRRSSSNGCVGVTQEVSHGLRDNPGPTTSDIVKYNVVADEVDWHSIV